MFAHLWKIFNSNKNKRKMIKEKKKITYEDGTTYEGSMTDGIYNGQGTITWTNGASYKGEWKNGKKDGIGQYTYPDKTTYKGGWKDDLYEGFGNLKFTNGSSYVGNFLKSKFHGKGIQCIVGSQSKQRILKFRRGTRLPAFINCLSP